MFKSLIATCLLTFSCSAASRQEVPQEENNETTLNVPMLANGESNNFLLGAYCLREDIDWITYNDVLVEYGSDFTFSGNPDCLDIDKFTYGYILSTVGTFECYFDIDYYSIYYSFDSVLSSDSYDFSRSYGEDLNLVGLKTYVYWKTPYYSQVQGYYDIKLFNLIFTQSGNSYNTLYSGWFTFNNIYNFNTSITLYGSFMANNNLYNIASFSSNEILFGNDNLAYPYNFYSNGAFNTDMHVIYLTGVLIPQSFRQGMQIFGVFDYVPPVQQYTFGELIFNIMDAPIYMLSQLFSFELFGVQFYVAFMSIVTLVLICFVLRKII